MGTGVHGKSGVNIQVWEGLDNLQDLQTDPYNTTYNTKTCYVCIHLNIY